MSREKPSYDLKILKMMFLDPGARFIRDEARDGAIDLDYLGVEEILDVVQTVSHSEFYKTMKAKKAPFKMQDVYHTSNGTDEIYINSH